ncbi:MAG: SDR family NAD(P)-dependent oxidoreductase, partial [Lachnospiraceae bacterium]|nr:SDR family NAD(P)-dependent oxidoreductase [Lachnospiraceae bacterium]
MKLPMKPDFTDKVAVVTGGAGVLCSAFCKALAACGAKVAVLDLTLERAEALAEEIRQEGGTAKGFAANVLDEESLKKTHDEIASLFGPCDILINGAGGNNPAATSDDEFFSLDTMNDPEKISFFDLTRAGFDKVFSLNIMGTLLPTQKFRQCQNRRNFRVGGMHIHCCHDAGNIHRYAYHCGNQSSVAGGSG